ncbi:AT-rich interactive domain-containing protein 3A-like isoform X1 [Branchiostoma floridae]|uniref:AT-rich interactive domain-containing protein 3A-like isoform X1 n=1 Tax=Branchiostoma floridae TaxID=7739 RepID=A0A9J7HXD4_BRAFL|nr:AT-rich interactive domain-containing protein 3A-like isoform X1 [Branchiostoma floridae]XP_035666074.1 AT-rich interactive domain-containing protein 3A-like isoform X1 [Branchiostoma floridae]
MKVDSGGVDLSTMESLQRQASRDLSDDDSVSLEPGEIPPEELRRQVAEATAGDRPLNLEHPGPRQPDQAAAKENANAAVSVSVPGHFHQGLGVDSSPPELSPESRELAFMQQHLNAHAHQAEWSFQEQFKQKQRKIPAALDSMKVSGQRQSDFGHSAHQYMTALNELYEIDDDPKRKEFLDNLFTFMQKRGTPVNRIPIMAKQTLDLYQLFNLVVERGGLVEVINKKLWREITKGLNLPSSITSAAFTLRTQYMKYLYPYECETKKLSSPLELQAAIDGNRRESRRASFSYQYGSAPTMIPPQTRLLATGNGTPHSASDDEVAVISPHHHHHLGSPVSALASLANHTSALEQLRREALADGEPQAKRLAAAIERATDYMFAAERAEQQQQQQQQRERVQQELQQREREQREREQHHHHLQQRIAVPQLPAANIKIGSLDNSDNKSLILDMSSSNAIGVSIELNGVLYQGVLYARNAVPTLSPHEPGPQSAASIPRSNAV